MVEKGDLSLGVPCAPTTLTHYTTKNGQLEAKEVVVFGRKFPLTEVREKLLKKHEDYMRLNTDDEIDNMGTDELKLQASHFNHQFDSSLTIEEMKAAIKSFQRTRHLIMWHDHSTILNLGCILMTIHIAYDPAVFLTQAEYESKFKSNRLVQSVVEMPVLYLFAGGSSSIEDQAALIPDRLDCLQSLSQPITTSTGIEVSDTLRFFIGDHPAQQFERGAQIGGKYKCAGCGTKDVMMDDLAHTLQNPPRSLQDLQKIAITGAFGKQAGQLKPFENLAVGQLRQELKARGKKETQRMKETGT